MPTSGIGLSDPAKVSYGDVKKKKLPYVVYKFKDDLTEIVIDTDEKFYKEELRYSALLGQLPRDDPRFVAFDFPHYSKENTKNSTVILVSWCPEGSQTRKKFLMGSTFLSFASAVDAQKKVQGSDADDVNEEEVCDKNGWKILPEEMKDSLGGPIQVDVYCK